MPALRGAAAPGPRLLGGAGGVDPGRRLPHGRRRRGLRELRGRAGGRWRDAVLRASASAAGLRRGDKALAAAAVRPRARSSRRAPPRSPPSRPTRASWVRGPSPTRCGSSRLRPSREPHGARLLRARRGVRARVQAMDDDWGSGSRPRTTCPATRGCSPPAPSPSDAQKARSKAASRRRPSGRARARARRRSATIKTESCRARRVEPGCTSPSDMAARPGRRLRATSGGGARGRRRRHGFLAASHAGPPSRPGRATRSGRRGGAVDRLAAAVALERPDVVLKSASVSEAEDGDAPGCF